MKRIFILPLALVFACAINEIFIAKIVGYPRYVCGSRKYLVHNKLRDYNVITWRPPFYRFWSVEGGLHVVTYNNIGLTGSDVTHNPQAKNLLLLGNSFIEAGQYDGDKIAAGILQYYLAQRAGPRWNVINLGASGHDPYVLWYRTLFFENFFKPSKAFLIYESFDRLGLYISRWHQSESLHYTNTIDQRLMHPSTVKTIFDKTRSMSAYLNLLTAVKSTGDSDNHNTNQSQRSSLSSATVFSLLKDSLIAYSKKFGDDFYFISIMRDNPYQQELQDFCLENGINFFYNGEIMSPQNLINGNGHLNLLGNKKLGVYLSEVMSNTVD